VIERSLNYGEIAEIDLLIFTFELFVLNIKLTRPGGFIYDCNE